MLVIFDCDGALVDSEPIVNHVESRFLSSYGWNLTPADVRALFKGRPFSEIVRLIEARIPAQLPDGWVYDLAMETALAFHRDLSAIPGVLELLERLHEQHVPLCVASQSSLSRVNLSLRVCKLDSFFGARVFSASMVPRPKPAPDIFLHAANELGYTPDDCVVIEDSPAGVHAAVAAGMRVFGYSENEGAQLLRQAGATTFPHMSELIRLLGVQEA